MSNSSLDHYPDQSALRDRIAVVGVGTTAQGRSDRSAFDLALEAFGAALEDAGLEDRHEIDGIIGWVGGYGDEGVEPLDFARLVGIAPRVSGQLDYGTGGFTLQYAAALLLAGACDQVACVFGRSPADALGRIGPDILYEPDHGLVSAASTAALGWARYAHLYGAGEEVLGEVVVAARRWAQLNPIAAHHGEPLSIDEYLATPKVVGAFRRLDIAIPSAGAVVLILTTRERAERFAKRPVLLRSIGRRQAPFATEVEDHLLMTPMRDAARQAQVAGGIEPEDVNVLMVSDASSAAVIQTLEHYGFCEPGGGADLVRGGGIGPGGSLAVNTSGGHLSESYLVGWLQHAELVRQLRGECGERQVAGAKIAQYGTTGRFRNDYLSNVFVTE